ncbi:hypothetical protein [Halorussus ruber]|uniref:hypothetical protein n=1 Tax=Halorussus ruber TaxID=1126238 RepID=UPI0010918E76|nr:hypothetical protein [Halorussus ruber]
MFFLALILAGFSFVVFDLGRELAPGNGEWQSYVAPVFVLGLLGIIVYQGLNGVGLAPTNKSWLLTVRPPKDVMGGQLLFRFCETLLGALAPTVAFFLGLSLTIGSPLPLLGGVAVALLVNAVGTVIGHPLGLWLKGIYKRHGISRKVVVIVGIPLAVGYAAFLYTGGIAVAIERLQPVVVNSPLGWIEDLALVTTPGSGARASRAAALLLGSVVFSAIATFGAVRISVYTWYADGSSQDGDETPTDDQSSTEPLLGQVLRVGPLSEGTRGVATASIRRTYRSGHVLVLVLGLLLVAGVPVAEQIITTGKAPRYTPWIVLFYGVSLAGSFHSLNILGVQGKTLPLVLTARVTGRQFVNGHVVAGTAALAPIATVLVVASGIAARWTVFEIVLAGALSPLAVCLGAMVATGIGTRLPRYRSPSVHRSSGVIRPDKVATVSYSVWCSVTLFVLFVLVDAKLRYALASVTGLSEALYAVSALAGLAVVGLSAIVSYRSAVARVSEYRLD